MIRKVYLSRLCPFCSRGEIEVYSRALSIGKCLFCGLLFRSSLQTEEKPVELYKNAWRKPHDYKGQTGGTNLRLAGIYLQKLSLSLGLKGFEKLKILDFGAGKGDILTALSELRADVYAVEPFGDEYLKAKGFKVFREIEEIPKGLLFDGVIAIDVIEHLFSPWDTINKLYGLLNHGGWFYIATPNANSLNARFSMSHWREFKNLSHIYFFNAHCLEKIFIKLGIFQYRRLRWFIRYGVNPLRNLLYFFLQFFKLDGELRYILRKG